MLNFSDKNIFNIRQPSEKKNKEAKDAPPSPDAAKKPAPEDTPISKIDIKQYRDLEGISLNKLQVALWFLANKKNFYYVLIGILSLIIILTWPRFIYTYGYYILKGMKDDKNLTGSLTDQTVNLHQLVLSQAPHELIGGAPAALGTLSSQQDFYTTVYNPNPDFYCQFDYSFNDGDQVFGSGQNYILPGDNKYILALGQDENINPAGLRFNIDKQSCTRITKHDYEDWNKFRTEHFGFSVNDIEFVPAQTTILSEKLSLNQLSFTVTNTTAYNFYTVDLVILLKSANRIIAVDQTRLDRFLGEETRTVDMTWPGHFGSVSDVEVIPAVNITDPSAYMKIDLGPGESK